MWTYHFNMRNYQRMKHQITIYLLTIFCFTSPVTSVELSEVDGAITLPQDKKDCSCSWTEWMSSNDYRATNGQIEDESYVKLRESGYEFCSNPVDIQCYNHGTSSLDPGFGTICDVKIGLKCSFLCDNYSVRVACCYCAPENIGPEFQINSQSGSGGCLIATLPQSSTGPGSVSVAGTCDAGEDSQKWAWVSKYAIKNIKTKQCLAVDGNSVLLEDCDTEKQGQKWKYLDRTSLLQYNKRYYLKKGSGGSLAMSTSRGTDSKWLAKVEEGVTSLKNMKSPKCNPPLESPGNGSLRCDLGVYVSSKCSFSCDYGFRLPEDTENPSECTDDGEFTVETPVCEKIVCNPVMSSFQHGSVTCANANNMDSSCFFKCSLGYALMGHQQLLCEDNGKWNHDQPKCERVTCFPDLEKEGLVDGKVNCTSGAIYQSKCSYECNVGFEMIGPMSSTCQIDEEWDETRPICQKIQCPKISAMVNSEMTCTAGVEYHSNCKFTCDVGYTMVGSATSTCNEDKTWSSDPPECERKTCNVLGDPDKGTTSCDDGNFYGSRCSFSCDVGFKIEGEPTLECTDEGWDFGVPKCTQITCSMLVNPLNGAVTCTKENLFGSSCSFTCSHGFKLRDHQIGATATIKCAGGGWTSNAPTCEKITCPELTGFKNGNLLCSNQNNYLSACLSYCNEGYDHNSGAQPGPVQCLLEGTWSGSVATCKRIQCRDINQLQKGVMSCSDMNNYNSTCTFSCKEGYNLLGSKKATCTKSGWDAQTPNCGRQTCAPPLARPFNGQINCKTTGLPVCTFSCNEGYRLIGASESKCQSDETWSVTDIPICEIKTCTAYPSAPKHGNVSCDQAKNFNSLCEFNCEVGYKLTGEKFTRCTDSQTWDHPTPSCKRISCPPLQKPVHGSVTCKNDPYYKSKCTYECDKGYKLIGEQTVECFLNSTWSPVPYCERITCGPSFSNPSNGQVECSDENNYDSKCKFTCEEGFSLEGESNLSTCRGSGWSQTNPPTCKKITCPVDNSIIREGSRQCDRANEYKSVCTYSCNRGYEVVGAKTVICTKQGRWSEEKPMCREIQCPAIPQIANGDVVCRSQKYLYNTECYFICKEGYQRTPDTSTVTCMENKRWNPAGFPMCKPMNVTEKMVSTTTRLPTTTTPQTTTTTTTTTITTTTESTVASMTSPKTTEITLTETIEELEKTMAVSPRIASTRGIVTNLNSVGDDIESIYPNDHATTKGTPNSEENSEGFPVVIVAVVVAVVLVVIVMIIIIVVWRKKSSKKTNYHNGVSTLKKEDNRYDHTELGPLIPNGNSVSIKKSGPISMDRLEMEYNRRHADDDKMFREEYHALVDGTGTKEAGGRAQNKDKNRYTNILPYDHSRVILPKIGMETDSDYINASFVDGYKHKGKFIAAQGPKENTITDFWRMVWEQNVSTVIMATNLEERKERKCAQYWPSSGNEGYGDLMVNFMGENHLVDYTIRLFTIQKINSNSTMSLKRNITQYHFTSWPDFGVPKSPSGILKFLRKIKHGSPTGYGPIVVHCRYSENWRTIENAV